MKVLGIDEAGKGPVIGPLIPAGAMIDKENIEKLKDLGVKDSKLLTPKKRDEIYSELLKIVKYEVKIVEPKEIDDALSNPDLNLNKLEAVKSVEIINNLNPDEAIIDCPSTNIKSYTDYIYQRINNKKISLKCEHKADHNHLICGAASIIAKTIREKEMEKIKQKYGNCGPGYPANKITQKFLQENWKTHPEIFRHSWTTYTNVVKKNSQKTLEKF